MDLWRIFLNALIIGIFSGVTVINKTTTSIDILIIIICIILANVFFFLKDIRSYMLKK